MKRRNFLFYAPTLLFVLTLLPIISSPTWAGSGGISVEGAWVRAMPPVVKNTAGYLVLKNHGKQDDQLLGVSADFAKVVEIHNVFNKGGMMEMRPVKSVPIPAGGSVALKPGSYHVMIIGLKRVPKEGETVELVLKFKRAGAITVKAAVRKGAPMKHGAGMKGMGGKKPMKMKQ